MSRDAMRGLTSTFLSMGPYAVSAKAVDRTLQRVGRAVGEAAFYWLAPDLDAAVGLAALHRGDLA